MQNYHQVTMKIDFVHSFSHLEVDLIILIEESGLGMADVQISTGFRWESDDNFAHFRAFKLHEFA